MLNYISDTLSVAKVYYNKSMGSSLEIVKNRVQTFDFPYVQGCLQILEDNFKLFTSAPGSSKNHQAWPGGYLDHIAETFQIAEGIYNIFPKRQPPVHLSDALLVLYLHDIEKPFIYSYEDDKLVKNHKLKNKQARQNFREELIKQYDLPLKKRHWHALKYVEGVRDKDYSPNSRKMNELATLCHLADMASARLWHNYTKSSRELL